MNRNILAQGLFAGLPDRYDLLAEALSFGQNGRWRRALVDRVADPAPKKVLDVATGTAGVALHLAERTDADITGIDLTAEMLARGRERVTGSRHRERIVLVRGRAEDLPFLNETFDALTFTYLLRYVEDPARTLAELARVLKPGGRMASLEFCVPANAFWRGAWWLHTRVGLPAAGVVLFSRAWYDVGRFLGPSISEHYRRYPVEWHARAWREAGFGDVGTRRMSLGGGLVMWGTKAP